MISGIGSKYDPLICSRCNNNKSQPWDKAYELFTKWIFDNCSFILERRYIPLKQIYGDESLYDQCVNLYKYFVKSFGCRLASSDILVPEDLKNLLDKGESELSLWLSFSVNRTMFALPADFRDSFLGIGDLYGFGHNNIMEKNSYNWYMNDSWLRIWFFYAIPHIPCGLGAPWAANSDCIYLGQFYSPTLEEFEKHIEDVKKDVTHEQLIYLEEIKNELWG